MRKVGIWIDKEKAHIVILFDDKELFTTIASDLEFYHPKGGSRSKTRWGPQEVMLESRYMEREKQQLKKYFQSLADKVINADQIVIFGPALTREKLKKEWTKSQPELATKILEVIKTDSMTDNQVKALVRDYYNVAQMRKGL